MFIVGPRLHITLTQVYLHVFTMTFYAPFRVMYSKPLLSKGYERRKTPVGWLSKLNVSGKCFENLGILFPSRFFFNTNTFRLRSKKDVLSV